MTYPQTIDLAALGAVTGGVRFVVVDVDDAAMVVTPHGPGTRDPIVVDPNKNLDRARRLRSLR